MSKLKAGDWVEVESTEEILAALDGNGRRDGLPFMPQMFRYCGKRLYTRWRKILLERVHETAQDQVFDVPTAARRCVPTSSAAYERPHAIAARYGTGQRPNTADRTLPR
jgi:hypothetical protein